MQALRFKTNINCGGCIKAVTPFLNQKLGDGNWKVNIDHPDKILEVSTEGIGADQVIQVVKGAGYQITPTS